MDLHVYSASSSIRLIFKYRPPSSTENGLMPSMFLDDFAFFMEPLALTSTPLFITRDLNIYVDDLSDHHTGDFCGILDNNDLEQDPTWLHTVTVIRLIFPSTRKSDDLVSCVCTRWHAIRSRSCQMQNQAIQHPHANRFEGEHSAMLILILFAKTLLSFIFSKSTSLRTVKTS